MNFLRLACLASIIAAVPVGASAQVQGGVGAPDSPRGVEGCVGTSNLSGYGGVSYDCETAVDASKDGKSSASAASNSSVTATALNFAEGGATLYYTVTYVGPDGDVPADIVASGLLSGITAETVFTARQGATDLVQKYQGCSLVGCPQPSWTVALTQEVQANVPIQVAISALVSGAYALNTPGTYAYGGSFAEVDPTFTIDPSFADAADYSIVLTQGVIQGVSAVPEPAAIWQLLAGVLCLAAVAAGASSAARRISGTDTSPR